MVKDFHLNSLKENIAPVVLRIYPRFNNTMAVRVRGEDLPATINHLQSVWTSLSTGWPFDYRFLNANFDQMYKAEDKLSTLFTFFTILTIIVACLGLFGLVCTALHNGLRRLLFGRFWVLRRGILSSTFPVIICYLWRSHLLLRHR